MKQMRAGLGAAGYVKHETWVLPENRSLLKQMEKQLRQPILAGSFMSENYMSAGNNWNIDRLYSALQALDEVVSNDITLSLVQGSESSIKLEMNDFGGLPIYIAVVGDQVIVDTVLVDVESINDVPAFNDAVLRSHSRPANGRLIASSDADHDPNPPGDRNVQSSRARPSAASRRGSWLLAGGAAGRSVVSVRRPS